MKKTYKRYDEYKDSGIDWLGEVPKHWAEKKLGAILEYKSVKNKPDWSVLSVYREYGVILKDSRDDNHNVTSADTTNYKVVLPGDLVINKMKAWQGSMGISNYEGIVSPAYITCKVKSKNIYSNYLHLLLRSNSYIGEYNRLSYGVRIGQWDMRMEDFKKIPIALPPLSEQQRIADFLDRKTSDIDKAIAQKEELINLLNERKQILINRAVTRGLNENVPLKDSGVEWIGEIPEHWEVRKLKYCAKILNGLDCDKQLEGLYPVYGSGGIFGWHDKFLYDEPSVLLGRKGTINKPQLVLEPFWTVDTAFYTKIDKSKVTIKYFYYLCITIPFEFYSSKTALPSMTQTDLYNNKFALPPLFEQQKISTWIEEQSTKIDQAITQKEEEITLLREYKSSLIDSAVRGQICLV